MALNVVMETVTSLSDMDSWALALMTVEAASSAGILSSQDLLILADFGVLLTIWYLVHLGRTPCLQLSIPCPIS